MAAPDRQWRLVVNLLDIVVLGIKMAPAVYSAYQKARGKLEQIITESRDPTLEEHEELNAMINALRTNLHKDVSFDEPAEG